MDHSVSKAQCVKYKGNCRCNRFGILYGRLVLIRAQRKVTRIYRRRHSLDNDKLCTVKSHALELLMLLLKQWDLAENRP